MFALAAVVLLLCTAVPQWSQSGSEHITTSSDAIDVNYVTCVKRICEYYFRTEHAMKGSLVIMNLTPDPTPFQSFIIGSLDEDFAHEFSVMVKDSRKPHMNASHVSEKAQNYFMFCETAATDVNSTVHQWHSLPTWNPQAQVVVLLTQSYDGDDQSPLLQSDIDSVLSQLLEHGMLNVNVIAAPAQLDVVQVLTWYPYALGNCAKQVRHAVVIDECEYRRAAAADTTDATTVRYQPRPKVPKIPATLHGCPLRVSSSVWEPYSVYDETDGRFTSGIEVLLIETIAAVLQLRTQFVLLAVNRENRDAYEGYMQLANRTTDILVGGMDEDSHTRKHLSASIPYYQDDQTWCVAVAKAEVLWKSFFKLFSLTEWAVIIAMIDLIAVILYFISRLDGRHENMPWMLLSSLSISLGLTTIYEPFKSNVRFMFLFFLFYGLIFSSAFHSFLVNVLSNPKQKQQVDSVEAAVASGFAFSGGRVPLSHYGGDDAISARIRGAYTQCDHTDGCLAQLLGRDDLAVSVSREHALNSPVIGKSDLFCFAKSHNVYGYSVVLLAQRNYHLLGRMNSIIRRVMEFGLIEKWEKDGDTMQQLQLQSKQSALGGGGGGGGDAVSGGGAGETGDELVVLKVDNIMGAMILMVAGYAVALVVFVAELAVNANWVKRRLYWVWWASDVLLNAQRYIWK